LRIILCSFMWLLDVQQTPPPLALSAQIAGQQAAAASLESAAQLAAAAWQSGQHDLIYTTAGALLSQSFESVSNGRLHTSQHQQVRLPCCEAFNSARLESGHLNPARFELNYADPCLAELPA